VSLKNSTEKLCPLSMDWMLLIKLFNSKISILKESLALKSKMSSRKLRRLVPKLYIQICTKMVQIPWSLLFNHNLRPKKLKKICRQRTLGKKLMPQLMRKITILRLWLKTLSKISIRSLKLFSLIKHLISKRDSTLLRMLLSVILILPVRNKKFSNLS
jgi:hypothetical protein